jgi:membrane protein
MEKRSFIKTRLIAVGLTLLLVTILLVAIIILNLGKFLIDYLRHIEYAKTYILDIVNVLRYIVLVAMFFFATSIIYFIAPSVKMRWSFFSHGAALATVLNVIASVSFMIYINNFSSYNKLYGSIGSIIAMMLWFYITSLVLLIGFEFNASIDAVRTEQKNYQNFKL